MRHFIIAAAAVWLCAGLSPVIAQPPVRADFSSVTTPPSSWTLSEGKGQWTSSDSGGAALTVTGTGEDMGVWHSRADQVLPHSLYRFRFTARVTQGSGTSTVVSGLDACNRDFGVTTRWEPYSFVFTTPGRVDGSFLRLGQWHLKGRVEFRNAELVPVTPVYQRQDGVAVGEGEEIDGDHYRFLAPLSGDGSNSARTLLSHTASFNSNRWVFGPGSEVIYKQGFAGAKQRKQHVTVDVGYYTGGVCVVSASSTGNDWIELGRLGKLGQGEFELPAAFDGQEQVWIRIAGASSGASEAGFQVDGYRYESTLDHPHGRIVGSTSYFAVEKQESPPLVEIVSTGDLVGSGNLVARVTAGEGTTGRLTAVATITAEGTGAKLGGGQISAELALQKSITLAIPYRCKATGPVRLTLSIKNMVNHIVYEASTQRYIPDFFADDFGMGLSSSSAGTLWWCPGCYKVSRQRAAPPVGSGSHYISISAAGRERVAFQLVLRAGRRPEEITVSTSPLIGPGGSTIAGENVQVRQVGYVPVMVPTDRIGAAADWPDPLPPLPPGHKWRPQPDVNNPLWVTVTVPAGARAGNYTGAIQLLVGKEQISAPVRLRVRGFSLPEVTEMRSGFGISAGTIKQFQNIKSDDALKTAWDRYMQDFKMHRMAPYDPMALTPIGVSLSKEEVPHVTLDFSSFDAAAKRYLDQLHFNSFTIGVQGMGNGRFPNYDRGAFLGRAAGSPEYDRLMREYGALLQEHLSNKCWIDKAYVYWYDEPEANDYPFVVEGMDRLKRYFPKLKRMLTEGFQKPLYDSVQLWCPITPKFAADPASGAERQSKGEEIWWYVCTGPKEPYCGLFIDHPAIELRMWLWQTWKYHVQGILIWETTWWSSPAQFKEHPQNCWTDPMSYVSDGAGVWGNGDGRMFYPPTLAPGADASAEYTGAPVDSIRWEMMAEGIQDWEYFHLLDKLVKAADARGVHSPTVETGRALLTVPAAICRDMTHFTNDPKLLYLYREKLAEAIERIGNRE